MRALVLDPDGTLSLRDRPKPARRRRMPDPRDRGRHLRHRSRAASRVRGLLGRPRPRVRRRRRRRPARRTPAGSDAGSSERSPSAADSARGCRAAGRGHCDVRTRARHSRPRRRVRRVPRACPRRNLHAVPYIARRRDGGVRRAHRRGLPGGRAGARSIPARAPPLSAPDGWASSSRRSSGKHGARVTVVVRGERQPIDGHGARLRDRRRRACSAVARPAVRRRGRCDRPGGRLRRDRARWCARAARSSSSPHFTERRRCRSRRWWSTRSAVIGSRCGPFARAIELLDAGRVDVKPLVAAVIRSSGLPRRSPGGAGARRPS